MTAIKVPTPQFGSPIEDGSGAVTKGWRAWFQTMFNRTGGSEDKVDAAFVIASAAAAQTIQVGAGAGLNGGGDLTQNRSIRLFIAVTPVAGLPAAPVQPMAQAFATNGRKPGEGGGAGTGCPVIWTNNNWYSLFSGAVVTA